MDAKLVYKVLQEKGGTFDHDEFLLPEDAIVKGVAVLVVDKDEYTSHSGSHKVTTNISPALTNKRYDYYVVKPLLRVYWNFDQGVMRVFEYKEYKELPPSLRILKEKVDGTPGKLWNYNLSPLLPIIDKARLGYFAWWVNGASRCQDLLVVRAPSSEREGAEWLAEWLDEKVPEYLAEKIKS